MHELQISSIVVWSPNCPAGIHHWNVTPNRFDHFARMRFQSDTEELLITTFVWSSVEFAKILAHNSLQKEVEEPKAHFMGSAPFFIVEPLGHFFSLHGHKWGGFSGSFENSSCHRLINTDLGTLLRVSDMTVRREARKLIFQSPGWNKKRLCGFIPPKREHSRAFFKFCLFKTFGSLLYCLHCLRTVQ